MLFLVNQQWCLSLLMMLIALCVLHNKLTYVDAQGLYINQFQCYEADGLTPSTTLTTNSFCQFSASCTPPISNPEWTVHPHTIVDPSTSSAYVKMINCDGSQFGTVALKLTYNVTNPSRVVSVAGGTVAAPPICTYAVSFLDCQKSLSMTIDAATVWELTKTMSTDLHTNIGIGVPGNTTALSILCQTITNNNANFQCIVPYEKESTPQSTCVLRQSVNFNCHEHLMGCSNPQIATSGNSITCQGITYSCNTSTPLSLNAQCTGVSLSLLRNLIADSSAASLVNGNTTYASCTALRNNVCKNVGLDAGNTFQCFRPRSESALSGDFCQVSPNFRTVRPYCGSHKKYSPITCYSDNGEDGFHTCLYPYYVDFLQTLNAPTLPNLAKPELNVSCALDPVSTGTIFKPLYGIANALYVEPFPPITLTQYEQLFCMTTFLSCPMWQLDGIPLTCNSTLRAQFDINQTNPNPFIIARRRMLAVLDMIDSASFLNFYTSTSTIHFSIEEMITAWQQPMNLSDPLEMGNSACKHDPQCKSLMNKKYNPVTLGVQLNLLSRSGNGIWAATSASTFDTGRNRHLLTVEDIDDSFDTNIYQLSQWEQLYYVEEQDNQDTGSRSLLAVNPSMVWTRSLWQKYLDMWCQYGKTEQALCSVLVTNCYAQPNQVFNCNGSLPVGAASNGLNARTYCSTYENPDCASNGEIEPQITFLCPASTTFSHQVVCNLLSPTLSCGYTCSINNFYLSATGVSMTGHELYDAVSDTDRCNLFNQRWVYRAGSCVAPYEHSVSRICYWDEVAANYTLQCGVMSIACTQLTKLSQFPLDYQLNNITLLEPSTNKPYYKCASTQPHYPAFMDHDSDIRESIYYKCVQGSTAPYSYGLIAPVVPLSYVTTESTLDLNIQCSRLRNFIKSNSVGRNVYKDTAYCCNTNQFIEPFIEEAGICFSSFTQSGYPLSYNFNCTSEGPDSVWPVNCRYNGDTQQYGCTSVGKLQFKCSGVDAYALYGQFSDQLNSTVLSDSAKAAINKAQCMVIRRSCHTSYLSRYTDFFACDSTQYQSNPNKDQFCAYSGLINYTPPSTSIDNVLVNFPPFRCGTKPVQTIYCGNAKSGSYPWYRCSNDYKRVYSDTYITQLQDLSSTFPEHQLLPVNSQYLGMDCLYNFNTFLNAQTSWASRFVQSLSSVDKTLLANSTVALMSGFTLDGLTNVNVSTVQWLFEQTKDEVCNVLLYQCAPFTCDGPGRVTPVVPTGSAASLLNASLAFGAFNASNGLCPTPIVQTLECALPAQVCDQVFCQLEASVVASSSSGTTSTCTFAEGVQNITCNGYGIVCSRIQAAVNNLNLVQYSCVHTGAPEYPSKHVQDVMVTLNAEGFTTPEMYQKALASAQLVTNPLLIHKLEMNCLLQSRLLSTGSGYGSSFDLSQCTGLTTDKCNKMQVCKQVGQYCLTTGQMECKNNGLATYQEPFCVDSFIIPTLDDTLFFCNGLAVQCYLPGQCQDGDNDCVVAVGNGLIFCTSSNRNGVVSTVWGLYENLNGLQNVLSTQPLVGNATIQLPSGSGPSGRPDGLRGCELPFPYFYQDAATRCNVLYDNCAYDCLNPNYNQDQTDGANFCESFSNEHTEFTCDDQWITCALLQGSGYTSDVNAGNLQNYIQLDPDYAYNQRMLQCKSYTPDGVVKFNNTLFLDCLVNQRLLVDSENSCATLVSQCRTNLGTITCADGYEQTKEAPLCTTKIEDIVPSPQCNCGHWWSNGEAANMWPEEMQQDTFTCASRGYVSIKDYMTYSKTSLTMAQLMNGQGWLSSWCLQSLDRPVAVCATLPGQRIPMCTLNCPIGLVRTHVQNSTTSYCCLEVNGQGPAGCTLSRDARQCVMGQHDVSLFLQAPHLFPDYKCPSNLFEAYTIYPLSAEVPEVNGLDDPLAHVRQLCQDYVECYGVTAVTDARGSVGAYLHDRPLQLRPERLALYDQTRSHALDKEQVYHLHPSPESQVAWRSSMLRAPGSQTLIQSVNTFVLERAYGFKCDDTRLKLLDYFLANLQTRQRIQNALNDKWLRDGIDLITFKALQYDDTKGMNNYIFVNNLNENPTLAGLFNLDLQQQIAYDLGEPYPINNINANVSTSILSNLFQRSTGLYPNLTSTNNAYPSILSTPIRVLANNQISSIVSIAQSFMAENDVLTAAVPNSCTLLTEDPPTTNLRYQWLNIRKYNEFLRYHLPIIGSPDGQYRGAMYVYNKATPPFIEVTSGGVDRKVHSTVLGIFRIESDDTYIVHFNDMTSLFYYMIWRDWIVYGNRIPTGYSRLGPNKQCILNTPLWFDYAVTNINDVPSNMVDLSGLPSYKLLMDMLAYSGKVDELKIPFPICSVARCPLATDPAVWQKNSVVTVKDPNSPLPLSITYPDPPSYLLSSVSGSIPCYNDHGVCLSSPNGQPGTGVCKCYSAFTVYTPISPYLSSTSAGSFSSNYVPASLKVDSCALDNRQACSNPTNLLGLICSGKGACVVSFKSQQQQPVCACGSFPGGCELNDNKNACALSSLPFVTNGFFNTDTLTQCQVPRPGCRFDYQDGIYKRLSDTYQTDDSFGCEVPRMNRNVLIKSGTCTATTDLITTIGGTNNVYVCQCKPGRYGTFCQYTSVHLGCFDKTDLLYKSLQANTAGAVEALCVFNPHLLQYESISTTAIPSSLLSSLPTVSCQGVICSNRGSCSFSSMNNPKSDLYVPSTQTERDQIQMNPYGSFSSARTLFANSVQTRLNNEMCVCATGYTGRYCQFRDCVGGCGVGYCVRGDDDSIAPYCVCPKTTSGLLLVPGSKCDGQICGGHGTLTILAEGVLVIGSNKPQPVYSKAPIYGCTCTPPYYQGTDLKVICQSICLNGTIELSSSSAISSTNSNQAIVQALNGSSSATKSAVSSSSSIGRPKAGTPPPVVVVPPPTTSTTPVYQCVCRNQQGIVMDCEKKRQQIAAGLYLLYDNSAPIYGAASSTGASGPLASPSSTGGALYSVYPSSTVPAFQFIGSSGLQFLEIGSSSSSSSSSTGASSNIRISSTGTNDYSSSANFVGEELVEDWTSSVNTPSIIITLVVISVTMISLLGFSYFFKKWKLYRPYQRVE